jgi:hypothetical protein
MVEDAVGVVVEALAEIGSLAEPSERRRRGGCGRWLIGIVLLTVLFAVIVIALNG